MKNSYYEPRYISNKPNNSYTFSYFEEEKSETLLDISRNNSKIVLLGNPGIGKTTELKNLFEQLWDSRLETDNFPFYINIKNFRKNSNFEELIPLKEWEELPITTFILDGLDEIAEIQDFISALELFIVKNNEKTIKIVLSCRTNIYEKYLIKIAEFKYYFLENLREFQITNILKKGYNLDLSQLDLEKYKVYLENPFNLKLFTQFHKENNRFPETQLDCWNLFIQTELTKLNKEKFIKRKDIDTSHISKCLEKVAFINELMQQNHITDDDLFDLIGKEDKTIFEQITFIERLPQSNKLIFRHKNYQEFFAAKYLSNLESTKIIEILKTHNNINKTKPSLFNTITFLLNILDGQKYDDIKKWLFENELEILFHSEPERLDKETRNEIFEKYFKENCIEKTFWIGKNGRFSMNTISEFANLDFLINHIIDNNNPFRSVKSALEVLSYTKITNERKDEIKNHLERLLFSSEIKYKEDVLRTIKLQGFHIEDKPLFLKIAEYFKDDYSGEINHQIIIMLNDYEDIDIKFEVLKNSLYKIYKIEPKKPKDNTIRGTHWVLEQLIFKITNPKNFIQVLNIIFNDNFSLKLSDFYHKNFKENLMEKISSFIKNDVLFLFKIVDAFLKPENNYIYRENQFLPELIKFSETEFEAFKYIYGNYSLTIKTFQLIAFISSKESVDYLLQLYKKDSLKIKNKDEINRLKWNLFNTNNELGYYFEKEMINSGFVFSENLKTEKEIKKSNIEFEKFTQENFDILFNKEELLSQINNVFSQNEKEIISFTEYHEINTQWYRKTNYHSLSNTVHEIISKGIREFGNQTFESISNILKDDYFILSVIKDKLKRNSNENYIIKDKQIDFIKKECFKILEDFNYDKIIEFSDDNKNNYSVYDNYFKLKTLYFFDIKFEFNYSTEFYLKTLKYCNIVGNSDQNDIFKTIEKRINDKAIFDKEVIKNITEEKLNYFSLKDHIDYAIEHKLNKTYKKITEYIINDEFLHSQNNLLLDISNLIDNESDFLKSCCKNIDSYLCWNAIAILKARKLEKVFIIDIADKYIISRKTSFLQQALNILFYGNKQDALKEYIKSLQNASENTSNDRMDGFIIEDIKNFTHIEELEDIKVFFDIVYNDNNKDTFDHHHSKQMLVAIINNFSTNEEGYKKLKIILEEIKEKTKDNYSKTFYINHLIDQSTNSYYTSLSKNLTFRDSKKIIENI